MTDRTLRELVDAAIEDRRPLDTPAFARLADKASKGDRLYWLAQTRLDEAVAVWRERESADRVRPAGIAAVVAARLALHAWRGLRTAKTSAALALGLSGIVVWSGREAEPPGVAMPAVSLERVMTVAPGPVPPARSVDGVPEFRGQPYLAPDSPSGPADGYAEATETAERLAYAFEPVGEHVGSVVRLLIDAVPGSDVFAM